MCNCVISDKPTVDKVDVNVVDDSGRLISFNIEPKISCWARHSGVPRSWTFDWARMFTMFSRDTYSCRSDVRFAMIKCCQKMSRASFPCVSIMLCFHCRYLPSHTLSKSCWWLDLTVHLFSWRTGQIFGKRVRREKAQDQEHGQGLQSRQ